MNNTARIWQFFRADAPRIGVALGLIFLSVFANLLKPWPLAILVDCVLGERPLPLILIPWVEGWNKPAILTLLAALVLLFHTGQATLCSGYTYLLIQIGLRGLARVRTQLFYHLQRLSLRYYQNTNQGDLIYRACWDIFAFQTLFQHGVFAFITAFLGLVLMVVIMWQMNRSLTLLALGTVPLLLLTMQSFRKTMNQRSMAAQKADSQVTSLVQQGIVAMPLTQSYNREGLEEERFDAQVTSAYGERLAQHGLEVLYLAFIAVVFGLGTAGVVWLGSKQVMDGQLSVGQMLIFIAYLGQFYEPLNQLSHVGATTSTATAGAQRVLEILSVPEEVTEHPQARAAVRDYAPASDPGESKSLPEGKKPVLTTAQLLIQHRAGKPAALTPQGALKVRGKLEFDHVSFGYQPHRLVVNDLSFSVAAGESVALIGPSGAGKSTLLHLLPRFFDPASGMVRLDGLDLRELRLKDLRAQISLVMQESLLLPATIAENIAYGKPNATLAEIEAAARASHADAFITQLPKQYDTLVGEGAARLSTGEKQRISLARAFLKDSPILVLDEPTSALDLETEKLITESLKELMRGRTTIIAAHRLPTIQLMDKLLVLEAGRITEMGTPAELLRSQGFYARITGLMGANQPTQIASSETNS